MRPTSCLTMFFSISIIALAWLSAPSGATTFFVPPIEKRLDQAVSVVRVEPGTSYTKWVTHSDGMQRVYTFNEVRVLEVLKGDIGDLVIVRQPGGEKDGVGLKVSGTAQLKRGEDVVLNLGRENPDGSHDLLGLSTGRFEIVKNSNGDEMLAGSEFQSTPPQDGSKPKRWSLSAARDYLQNRTTPQENDKKPSKNDGKPDFKTSKISLPDEAPSSLVHSKREADQEQDAADLASIPRKTEKGRELWKISLITLLGFSFLVWLWRRRRKP